MVGDTQSYRHPGPLVEVRTLAGLVAEDCDDPAHETGNPYLQVGDGRHRRLLVHDVHLDVGV